MDQSAAFDVVDHQIFLEKLKTYNFSEESICWFKSYLENRYLYTQVESKISKPQDPQNYGVPQGSILGPLIYIIHCNDFPASTEEGESVMYADDDTDNTHDSNPLELRRKIQIEANISTSWVKDNRLVCSGEKTKLLIIGTAEQKRKAQEIGKIEIDVCGNKVTETESEMIK